MPASMLHASTPLAVETAATNASAWSTEAGRVLAPRALTPDVGYAAFRAVLHALHRGLDSATRRELSAALPTLLRGVFHEPLDEVGRADTRDGFLLCVERSMRHRVRPEEAVRAVCTVLARRLPPETWSRVEASIPIDIVALLDVAPHPQ